MSFRDKLGYELSKARSTGQRKAIVAPLIEASLDLSHVIMEAMDEIDLRVVFLQKMYVRPPYTKADAIEELLDSITNTIFRDARDALRELEIAYMNDDDRNTIKDLFRKVWEKLA